MRASKSSLRLLSEAHENGNDRKDTGKCKGLLAHSIEINITVINVPSSPIAIKLKVQKCETKKSKITMLIHQCLQTHRDQTPLWVE